MTPSENALRLSSDDSFDEEKYENAVVELLVKTGYKRVDGANIDREPNEPFYLKELTDQIKLLNPSLPRDVHTKALEKLRNIEGATLVQKNKSFMDYLQNGVPVSYLLNGEERSDLVYLVDFKNPENNSFVVSRQFVFKDKSNRRFDLVLFVNGLPLVAIELKSPSRDETDASKAYLQLRNYMKDLPKFFVYNAICVMSDMSISKAGTITSSEDRFMEWKTKDGKREGYRISQFDVFFEGLFDKSRFLDILKNFLCFSSDGVNESKILAGYHQYYAVRRAIGKTVEAMKTDGKGGVFWHTQGSGKSLSMVFYAHLLQEAVDSPTIVVLTDRNDLDNQLYGQFAKCRDFLRQEPVQAKSRAHLRELLEGRRRNGIFFTTMQKFTDSDEPLSKRRNIVVMADEAHRGQYGLAERYETTTNEDGRENTKRVVGAARRVRNSLPNATYIGFTGTPISTRDRCTREVFGDYIDVYDMSRAVKDGATLPIYYESRIVKLGLNEETLKLLDDEYDAFAMEADETVVEKSKRSLGNLESILGADGTINSLVDDILEHYEKYREELLTGKALIVAYSRKVAMKIYRRMLELRPDWTEKVAVVMTENNADPEDWREIVGDKRRRDELARQFKDDKTPLKIAIVVDMWLTGFDVPSLATMYVYKPMCGHNLMQAIARVNRVFRDKEGGLVVDYIGLAAALRNAMKDYTREDQDAFGDPNVEEISYPQFKEKLALCRELFRGYDYSEFMKVDGSNESSLTQGKIISEAANFMFAPERKETREKFLKEAHLMKRALFLCSSVANEPERVEAGFFNATRVILTRVSYGATGNKITSSQHSSRLDELIKECVKCDGVLRVYANFGDNQGFSLFDPKFLEEIRKMKQKNLAFESLKKIVSDQVKSYRRTNLVKSKKFSDIMQEAVNKYVNGQITNEQVIEKLIELAKELMEEGKKGKELGLTSEELAFYDALSKPENINDFCTNEQLIALTKELTQTLRMNRTLDWNKKKSAQAKMRRAVKKLLNKYDYPPGNLEDAVVSVIEQCRLMDDGAETEDFA